MRKGRERVGTHGWIGRAKQNRRKLKAGEQWTCSFYISALTLFSEGLPAADAAEMFWVPVGAQGGNHFLQKMKKDITVALCPFVPPPPSGSLGRAKELTRNLSIKGVKEGKQKRWGGRGGRRERQV